jgi:hypothetical protein
MAQEARAMIDLNPNYYDEEDAKAIAKLLTSAQKELFDHEKQIKLPNSLAFAANFAEEVNARLKLIEKIKLAKNNEITQFFQEKQLRLALQAEEMIKISMKENVGSL